MYIYLYVCKPEKSCHMMFAWIQLESKFGIENWGNLNLQLVNEVYFLKDIIYYC